VVTDPGPTGERFRRQGLNQGHVLGWDTGADAIPVASVSVSLICARSGIEMVISVPGDVERTSHWPPAANAFARIDARPM